MDVFAINPVPAPPAWIWALDVFLLLIPIGAYYLGKATSEPGSAKRRQNFWGAAVTFPMCWAGAAFLLVLTWSARRAEFEVSPAGVDIKGELFYGGLFPAADLKADEASVVDWTQARDLWPAGRTNGTAWPGYAAGWFRLRDGSSAFMLSGGSPREMLVLPTTKGYKVLLAPENPADMLAAVQKHLGTPAPAAKP